MKITYDPTIDALQIIFSNAPVQESDQDKPDVILDYDTQGNIVSLEILNASKHVENVLILPISEFQKLLQDIRDLDEMVRRGGEKTRPLAKVKTSLKKSGLL